ncbi:MAG: hypothetical protein KIT79_05865 [Deltaproteobacteria bacterium]|nr:hypothetical protein [Deltaproteobacteria bacterium]
MKTPHPLSALVLLPLVLVAAFVAGCHKPGPEKFLTIAVSADIRADFEPLLKTPHALGGYGAVVVSGPAASIPRRIRDEGFSPDMVLTSDASGLLQVAGTQLVEKAVPVARRGDTTIALAFLRRSSRREGYARVMDFLRGAEAAARMQMAGYEPVGPAGETVVSDDGREIRKPPPGTQIGRGSGY